MGKKFNNCKLDGPHSAPELTDEQKSQNEL